MDTVEQEASSERPPGRLGWTFVAMSIGIGLIACCLLIPQADENRRLAYECAKLRIDLDHLKRQIDLNEQFLKDVGNDPVLAERLAQRQMKFVRKGAEVMELAGEGPVERSPFGLVNLAPPSSMPEFRLPGGMLVETCRSPKSRLYLMGAGLMLLAMGLVLGNSEE